MHDLFYYDKFEMLLTEVISGDQKATKSLSTKHSFLIKYSFIFPWHVSYIAFCRFLKQFFTKYFAKPSSIVNEQIVSSVNKNQSDS